MEKVEDIVGRLRDKSAHSAEAYGLEEYMPMAAFWKSYADLSAEAADLIQSQQALIEEMRHILLDVVNGAHFVADQTMALIDANIVTDAEKALSQKDQIDG